MTNNADTHDIQVYEYTISNKNSKPSVGAHAFAKIRMQTTSSSLKGL